jgi:predicted Zn-dependent peptidase
VRPKLASLACALVLLTGAPALAQDVPYEKYKLPNGMTVILHEDHTLPTAAVNLWYRVGSKDEPTHRTGFAHLFEHLMFMGTKRVPNGSFDQIMESGGGDNNASTSSDRTNFFSKGPARLLPTLLWLDAERLEDLGRNMTKEKVDKQRDVVRNELRQSYENAPYGKADLQVQELMYPVGHPYHIPVIGTHEDLEAATAQDVRDFFATFYVPNNCSLVVAGDFDPAKTKPLIAELFGTIARGGEPLHRTAGPVKVDHVIRATVMDSVQLPRLSFAYHSPAGFQDGDAEMDLVASVLTSGNTSRLYKRLVYDEKLCTSVSASQSSEQLGSLFRIDVTPNDGADLDQVEKIVDEEIARFLESGPTPAELERQKASFELGKLTRLQSVEAKADELNEYEYYWGEPNSFKRDLDRYRNATPEKVRDWARTVLTKDARLIMRVVREERLDKTPRDVRPKDGAETVFAPKGPESFTLSNGIPVLIFPRPTLPLVTATMLFRAKAPFADALEGKAGLPALTADMLSEGAGALDALQFGDELATLGATFGADAGHETASAQLTVLRRNFEKAAGLMADAVRRPRFEAKEWERVQRLHIDGLKEEQDQPPAVASHVANRLLFGDKNPFAWATEGTEASVAGITVDDLKAAHRRIFQRESCTIVIAGDLTAKDAKATLEKLFSDWPASEPAEPKKLDLAIPAHDKLRVALVDHPEAVQTVIRFMMPGPTHGDERRVPLEMFNTLFGGSFTSRLNQNLREAHGYTYGAGSGYSMGPEVGYFSASADVKADTTGASIKEFLGEIDKIRKGDVTDEETEKARATLRTEAVQSFQGLSGVVGLASGLLRNGLGWDALAKDAARLEQVKAEDLNKLAKGAIPLEQGVLVLVGDKKLILEQLKGLGLPEPVELDAKGDPAK